LAHNNESNFVNSAYDNRTSLIDTGTKKFGAGSGRLITSDETYVSYPDSADWELATSQSVGDFTIDFWAMFRHAIQQTCFIRQVVDNSNRWLMQYHPDGYLQFYAVQTGFDFSKTCSWSPAINTWYHIAIVKSGSNFYMFIDGDSKSVTSISDNDGFKDLAAALEIGKDATYADVFIDELRISKGIARWTEDFTPPTGEYSEGESLTLDASDSISFTDAIVKSTNKRPVTRSQIIMG
jgi:hypothetical protein